MQKPVVSWLFSLIVWLFLAGIRAALQANHKLASFLHHNGLPAGQLHFDMQTFLFVFLCVVYSITSLTQYKTIQ